jgi:hypothetical protein
MLAQMPDDSVDCSVFSSPFSSLYIYSDSERDMGNANSHAEFLEHHAFFARELFRVMKPGSVICDHLKDIVFYQGSSESGESGLNPFSDWAIQSYRDAGFQMRARVTIWTDPVLERSKSNPERLLYKNIGQNSRACAPGMPEYVAVMRKDAKGIKIGDPVRHAVAKEETSYFRFYGPEIAALVDAGYNKDQLFIEAAKHLALDHAQRMLKVGLIDGISPLILADLAERCKFPLDQWQQWASPVWMDNQGSDVLNARFKGSDKDERHLCPMPLPYIERCLQLYSVPGDIVLDPFSGIGSTGYQAVKMGRKFIGSELKPEYAKQAARFIGEAEKLLGDLFGVAA